MSASPNSSISCSGFVNHLLAGPAAAVLTLGTAVDENRKEMADREVPGSTLYYVGLGYLVAEAETYAFISALYDCFCFLGFFLSTCFLFSPSLVLVLLRSCSRCFWFLRCLTCIICCIFVCCLGFGPGTLAPRLLASLDYLFFYELFILRLFGCFLSHSLTTEFASLLG